MSNEEQKNSIEPEKKVVITPEDAKAAMEFWTHFNVPFMPGLKEAFEAFINEPTYENQQYLKYISTKAIATTDHEAFKDETFQEVAAECGDVSYEMEFDREFEQVIGEK